MQPPELYQTLRDHSLARPDRGSALDISQALSSSINPGYFLQDPEAIKSQSKEDFTVDEDEVSDVSLYLGRLQLPLPTTTKDFQSWHAAAWKRKQQGPGWLWPAVGHRHLSLVTGLTNGLRAEAGPAVRQVTAV